MNSPYIDDIHPQAVAVIGAGPAGLVTARWLAARGFEPVLFEASGSLGGQWNAASALSATWPGMRTNTSRILTSFSDLDHPVESAVYPPREGVKAYLERYAALFGLAGRTRWHSRVEQLRKDGAGYLVVSTSAGSTRTERFARVVVASGRYVAPHLPVIRGQESFTGALGAMHTARYPGASLYRGKDVLVAGCSISALEIASDLALSGANSVTACYRRQRYVLPKLIAGVPTDHVMFTRAAALAGETLPPDMLAEGLKRKVVSTAGNPAQYGAMIPDEDIFAAGLTQSQHFLPLVAEARIAARPWPDRIEGRRVFFADGSSRDVDAILFGTGFRLSLPFLSSEIADCLGLDDGHADLCDHTFHPDLPGLAFAGLYDLVGPAFPVLELQARWIAYAWAGTVPAPSASELQAGLARSRAGRSRPGSVAMHDMAVLFARNAHVEPDRSHWPGLERALLFGPLSPISFRLEGPDSLPDAAARTITAAAAFGAIASSTMSPEEAGLRDLIGGSQDIAARTVLKAG